jgi:hypothetical protein
MRAVQSKRRIIKWEVREAVIFPLRGEKPMTAVGLK